MKNVNNRQDGHFSKRVLITGASGFIGRQLVGYFFKKNYQVLAQYCHNRNDLFQYIPENCHNEIEPVFGDFSSEQGLREFIAATRQRLENNALDLVINCVGLYSSDSVESLDITACQKTIFTNALSSLSLIKNLPINSGALYINIGDARQNSFIANHFTYGLSKNLLATITQQLALILAPDIRVNMVALGQIDTGEKSDFSEKARLAAPLKRLVSIQEVANTIEFLIESPAITGQIIYLDGGRFLKGSNYER